MVNGLLTIVSDMVVRCDEHIEIRLTPKFDLAFFL